MKRRYCVLRTIFAGVMVAALFSGVRVCGQEAAGGSGAAEFDEADAWVFNPPEDEFSYGVLRKESQGLTDSDEAFIDLRYLNEKEAGETGFIGLSKDGMSFVKGDGTPIRFWSVVDGGWDMEPEKMDRHVRWLAKLGVNMVRVHAQLCQSREGDKITDINEKQIDGILRYVASCKNLGIYVTISPFWAHVQKIPASWEIEGYTGESGPTNLLFFDERMQEGYRSWVRPLYTRTNPHTGIALKDDPAVAIIQIQNEDSLFFWTFNTLKEPHKGHLRKLFGDWLTKKYGSMERVVAAWKDLSHGEDNFDAGEAGLYNIWDFTSQAPRPDANKARRMADQLNFLAELQYKFHTEMGEYYQNELGCKQIINASNWRSADPVLLEDVERWTYTANEVAAMNRYTGGVHSGPMNGWRVDPGHIFISESCLKNPEAFPGALKQTVGQPMIITESAWVHPTLYQSEGPFMMAAYHSLTGMDSLYWFAYGDEATWTLDPVWPYWNVEGKNSLKKWYGSYPMQAGMFPATALAYRLGYIKAADGPVIYEERNLRSLWYRQVPIIAEAGKFDVNRDKGDFAPQSPIKQEVDRLSFMVGPVHVKFGGNERNSKVVKLSDYIDRDKGVVKSVTGQIALNYKTGVCTVNSPKLQGVSGFLKDAGGFFKFDDVTIESDNDYATIVVAAMDDRPLAQSGKVLIQVGTVCRLTGWRVCDTEFKGGGGQMLAAKRIVEAGRAPWLVVNTKAKVMIKNSTVKKATLIDPNGYPVKEIDVVKAGGTVSVKLPGNAMYVMLQ